MKREISMRGDEAIDMLKEIDKQDDVRVAQILRLRWNPDNQDDYLWQGERCLTCKAELFSGDIGHVWGKPVNNEAECTTLTLLKFCETDDCIERAMEAWAWELKKDVMAAYFGDFDGDDLDLES